MGDTMTGLEVLKDTLGAIHGVKTCKIGFEEGIEPEDYPIIRIIPARMGFADTIGAREVETHIVFGAPTDPLDDTQDGSGYIRLEKCYSILFELEKAILDAIVSSGGDYLETITDEDRLDTFKLMAVRAKVYV